MLLAKCVELAIAEGLPVTARKLHRRFGGDWVRIEEQLVRLTKQGKLRRYITTRAGLGPFTAYVSRGTE